MSQIERTSERWKCNVLASNAHRFGFASKYGWKLLCTWRDWSFSFVCTAVGADSAHTATSENSWSILHFLHLYLCSRAVHRCSSVAYVPHSATLWQNTNEFIFRRGSDKNAKNVNCSRLYASANAMAFDVRAFNLNLCWQFRVIIICQLEPFNHDPLDARAHTHTASKISHFPGQRMHTNGRNGKFHFEHIIKSSDYFKLTMAKWKTTLHISLICGNGKWAKHARHAFVCMDCAIKPHNHHIMAPHVFRIAARCEWGEGENKSSQPNRFNLSHFRMTRDHFIQICVWKCCIMRLDWSPIFNYASSIHAGIHMPLALLTLPTKIVERRHSTSEEREKNYITSRTSICL